MKFYKIYSILFFVFLFSSFSVFAEIYKNDAVVSFYAEDFHGKKTSNGETFNMYSLTCASKNLPFDTELKITNLKNGKSVIVRVNDRGPFVPNRELDLSKQAAVQLGMVASGTAHVKIEIIKRGPDTKISQQTAAKANQIMVQRYGANWNKNSTAKTPTTPQTPNSNDKNKQTISNASATDLFEIQIASFSTKTNAQNAAKKLYSLGFRDIFIRSNGEVFRVVIKNIPKNKISEVQKKLDSNNYTGYIVRVMK